MVRGQKIQFVQYESMSTYMYEKCMQEKCFYF